MKDLAKETARATDEISRRILAIQSDASNACHVIGQIGDIIGQIDSYQTTVAAAVEEQTATTKEISENVSSSAIGSADISRHIAGISERAARAKFSAEHVEHSAESLNDIAVRLQALAWIIHEATRFFRIPFPCSKSCSVGNTVCIPLPPRIRYRKRVWWKNQAFHE